MERQHLAHVAELLGGGPPGFSQALSRCDSNPVTYHKLGQRLLGWWRRRAHAASQKLYRSPLYTQPKPLPHGLDGQACFTYERSLWPIPLEQSNPPAGWRAEVVLCRSLEAAYWTGLTTLQDMLGAPQTWRSLALRPKQQQLLEWMSGKSWQGSVAFGPTTFLSSLAGGRAGLFLWGPDAAISASQLLEAWQQRPRGAQAILWLESPNFDGHRFLQELRHDPPWLTVVCQPWNASRSLGLPLSCLGQLTFYAPASAERGMTPLDTAGELSRRVRSVLGVSVSFPELSEWCWATRLNCQELAAYRQRLRDNAQQVRHQLQVDVNQLGAFRWDRPADPKRLSRLAIFPSFIPEALGHSYRQVEDQLEFVIGWRSVDALVEVLLQSQPGRASSPSRAARNREWPAMTQVSESWRRRLLQIADQRHSPTLEQLESRLLAYDDASDALLFRSGMTAIASLWLALQKLIAGPLKVAPLGRYFESLFLQQVLQAPAQFEQTPLPQAPIVVAESVAYDWELTPLDVDSLRHAQILILDTTLTGQRLRLIHLPRAPLAIRVFSGIKLEQQGLELENCGAVLLAGNPREVNLMAQSLRAVRRSTGGQLSSLERRRLAPPFVFDPHLAQAHQEAVFANNAWLARQLTQVQGGLLARVVHPSLIPKVQSWACAPFVVLHLKDQSIEAHRHLTAVLEYEAQRRKLPLGRGASFGFLDHRHEFIIPVLRENRALFKVAMGARQGRTQVAIGQLLQEVLAYPDSAHLVRAYPHIQLAPAPADWAAPSARLLEFLEGSD